MIKKVFIFIFISVVCALTINAQNNTSSPYTRYGYGSVVEAGFGQVQSMGGLSYGLRSNRFINPGNPASYTAIDSLTFRIEAGASFKISNFADNNASETAIDGNLEYLAIQFPIKKWLGVSLGMMPYSFVGYDYSVTQTTPSSISAESLTTTYNYEGTGGITQLYLGLAVSPVKWLSVGANLQYNFGTIENTSTVLFDETSYFSTYLSREIDITDLSANFGLQAEVPLSDDQTLTLGGVFQMKSQMNADAKQTAITTDTVVINFNNDFDSPMSFGVGFVYNKSNRFLAGFDYKREAWSEVRYFGEKDFSDRNRFSVGLEFHPDENGRSYFQRVYYRLGANYSKSYYKVNGSTLNDYALSGGFGFPLKKGLNPTILNFSFEYGHNGTKDNDLIREQYFKFTLNTTINERWFVKRKLN